MDGGWWWGGGCIAIAYPNEQRERERERGAQFPKDGLLFCAKMKREQGVVVSDASELLFEDIKKAERTTKTRCSNMPYLCNHQPASHVHKTPAYFYLFKLAHSTRVLCSSLLPPPVSSAIHLANVPYFGGGLGLKSNRVDPKFSPHRELLSSPDGRPHLVLPESGKPSPAFSSEKQQTGRRDA